MKKGQSLFQICSKNMAEGDYYTKIKANYEAAKANYDRAESLVKDQIISRKDFEATRLEMCIRDSLEKSRRCRGCRIREPEHTNIINRSQENRLRL